MNLIALPLKWVIDKFPKMTFMILWILLLSGIIKSLLFCLEVNALVYFCMGFYLVKYDLHFEKIADLKFIPILVLYIVTCAASYVLRDTTLYTIVDNVNICVGFVVCIMLVARFNSYTVINSLARYSFNIFIMHEMFLRIALKATAKFLGTSVPIQVVQYFVIPGIIICFCIIMSVLMEKMVPKFYRIFTGARG